jgi:hypothetical protein
MGPSTVSATTAIRPAAAMHSTPAAMHAAAVAHAAASATGPHLSDETVVHVGRDALRSEDLEGLSLRQSEAKKRNAKTHVSGQMRPTHGFPPSSSWGDPFADWKFQYPHEAVSRPDRYTLCQPRLLSNSRIRTAQRNWPPARLLRTGGQRALKAKDPNFYWQASQNPCR